MSEYQYYEFRSIDQALTPAQMKEVRGLSTRAEVTNRSFSVTYSYSDFRGNPRQMMERYYDAHVYVSNFGNMILMLRLPLDVISGDAISPYTSEDALDWWTTEEHIILEWQLNEDEGGDWVDGEGWIDRLVPLRDELIRGDYRSLYIGWLASFAGGSSEEDEEYEEEEDGDDADEELETYEDDFIPYSRRNEPPVPAGLDSITAAQAALAEFLGVSLDLIRAASAKSPKAPVLAESTQKVSEWVAGLPEQEVRAYIERVVRGEATRVQTELQSRFFRSENAGGAPSKATSVGKPRTAADLVKLADQTEQERKLKEQRERDHKRHTYLVSLVPRFADLWLEVNALAAEQKASSYDRACALLVDLRAAYSETGRRPEFDVQFERFLGKYSRSAALVRRLKDAEMTPKEG